MMIQYATICLLTCWLPIGIGIYCLMLLYGLIELAVLNFNRHLNLTLKVVRHDESKHKEG